MDARFKGCEAPASVTNLTLQNSTSDASKDQMTHSDDGWRPLLYLDRLGVALAHRSPLNQSIATRSSSGTSSSGRPVSRNLQRDVMGTPTVYRIGQGSRPGQPLAALQGGESIHNSLGVCGHGQQGWTIKYTRQPLEIGFQFFRTSRPPTINGPQVADYATRIPGAEIGIYQNLAVSMTGTAGPLTSPIRISDRQTQPISGTFGRSGLPMTTARQSGLYNASQKCLSGTTTTISYCRPTATTPSTATR